MENARYIQDIKNCIYTQGTLISTSPGTLLQPLLCAHSLCESFCLQCWVLICEEMAVGKPFSLLSVSCQNKATKSTIRFWVQPQANPLVSHQVKWKSIDIRCREVLNHHVQAKLTMANMVKLTLSIREGFIADKCHYSNGAYSFGIHQHNLNLHKTMNPQQIQKQI